MGNPSWRVKKHLKNYLYHGELFITMNHNRYGCSFFTLSGTPLLPCEGFRQDSPNQVESSNWLPSISLGFQPCLFLLWSWHGNTAASMAFCTIIWMLYCFPFIKFLYFSYIIYCLNRQELCESSHTFRPWPEY